MFYETQIMIFLHDLNYAKKSQQKSPVKIELNCIGQAFFMVA